MKKHLSTILIILVFFVGLIVLLYPSISNWYNERMNSHVVSNYNNAVGNKDTAEYAQILADARDYNEKLHSLPKDFISGTAQEENYINALNVYNGIMGYIVIDKLDVKLAISHGTGEDVLQKEIGHLEGSSLPTGDVGNNTVLTGHTGLPSAELFTDLNLMEIGDTFHLYILDQVFEYKVFNIVTVLPHEVNDLKPIDGKDVVTLITCTPYGVNSHRLLVQGEQIEIVDEPEEQINPQTNVREKSFLDYIPVIAICIILVLLILIIISYIRDKKYK